MEQPQEPADGDFAEPEQTPGYWTAERLRMAAPVSFPEEPPGAAPPAEGGDGGAGPESP
jgi:hypothetical protein